MLLLKAFLYCLALWLTNLLTSYKATGFRVFRKARPGISSAFIFRLFAIQSVSLNKWDINQTKKHPTPHKLRNEVSI